MQPKTSPEVICSQSASLRMLGAKRQHVFFTFRARGLHLQRFEKTSIVYHAMMNGQNADPPSSIQKSRTGNNVMYWTSEHDILLCREVVSDNTYKTRKGSLQRSEIWDRIANTLNTCPKPVFAVDKRSVRDHVGILINRIKKKLRAEERSSGIAPPEPTELENLVEEILALEETADAEMKEDDESVKGKAEKERAKATDMRLKALEKVSETMKRHSDENDQQKVKKRERRSGSETMLFLSKKAEKDQELKLEELQLKKEQHDLDQKRLQASIDQQHQFQQQQSEMMRLMQEQQQQQQQQLLASQHSKF